MNLKRFFLSGLSVVLFLVSQGQQVDPGINADEIRSQIRFLASDEMAGRFPGTPQSLEAAKYIRDRFKSYGMEMLFDEGFQEFEPVVKIRAGEGNQLVVNGEAAVFQSDFMPMPFSRSSSANAPVVFAGYGFSIHEDSLTWDDYEGIDVSGKWVLILRGDPEMDKKGSRLAAYGEDRDKAIVARDRGAGGVLLVSGKEFDAEDDLISLYFDKTSSNAGIPVFQVRRKLADRLLASANDSIAGLESRINSTMKSYSLEIPGTVEGTADIIHEKVQARNVVARIPGNDPELSQTAIVIGAHYDHLGMGGPGSGSRLLDSMAVHNGADDNASGTAGIIELAKYFSNHREELKRSLIFVAFDGEEQGLLGSKHFVEHPPLPMKNIAAMFNFDMIGRMDSLDRWVMVGGSGTSAEGEGLMSALAPPDLKVKFSTDGYGPSDHAAFYAENIPVFFFSTGAHDDYHMPEDDWQKINYNGEKMVLDYAALLIGKIASCEQALTFREAGPKQGTGRSGYRFKVTLGIMPDVAGGETDGLGVSGVRKDGPAYRAGIQKGDIIVGMQGEAVHDIYDYMNRLQKLKAGQVISVDILRQDKKMVLIVQL